MFTSWEVWVTKTFTWLYIFTQDVWIAFIFILFFSKYSKLTLGRDGDRPEFDNFSWFAMIFSAGVATGLFFYGVGEPVYYYKHQQDASSLGWGPQNRFTYLPNNQRAAHAMNITWYHWGLHGWVCYALMGALLAFLHFRKGLPMTVKTCFYPLLGVDVYGFAGDILDIVSTVATTIGVCCSLGLGVMQLDAGFTLLNGGKSWAPGAEEYFSYSNWDAWKGQEEDLKSYWNVWPEPEKLKYPWYKCCEPGVSCFGTIATEWNIVPHYANIAHVATEINANNQQIILVWLITACATLSVMLGLARGVRTLANICLSIGMFIIIYIWLVDDTYYICSLIVQACGMYVQYIFEIGFYTGAFSHNEAGDQSVTDYASANPNPGGEYGSFMRWWTIFYWGWWIAWAPFVGVFLARISRGRTLKSFIMGSIVLPSIYNLIFIGIMGGAALKMQLLAEKYEIGCSIGTEETVQSQGQSVTYSGVFNYGRNICRAVGTHDIFTNEKELFCSTVYNLGCVLGTSQGYPKALYYLMSQYSDMGRFMIVLTMIALFLYFIASSDSGSMVDDMVTANGIPEPPLAQRLFWSCTEGAAATALLHTGKFLGKSDASIKTLRSLSLCVGLPYTFLICFMCVALWRAVQYEQDYVDNKESTMWTSGWSSKISDIGITFYTATASLGEPDNYARQATKVCNCGKGKFDLKRLGKVVANTFCPAVGLWPAAHKLEARRSNGKGSPIFAKAFTISCTFLFYGWLICCFCEHKPPESDPYEWGMVKSGTQNGVAMEEDTRTYQSERYGYFREWDSNPADDDGLVRYRHNYDAKAGETIARGFSMPPGPQTNYPRRIEAIGWFFFFFMVTLLAYMRSDIRAVCGISGTLAEDFCCATFWPMCTVQMAEQIETGEGDKSEAQAVVPSGKVSYDEI
jgi:choline-glycine betaine transporter